MEHKEYNGWTNYETWLVNRWMSNDAGGQAFWDSEAQDIYDGAEADKYFTREERATLDLSDRLKDYFENEAEAAGLAASGLWADMINAALSEVNWHEIAEHLMDEVEKEEPAKDEHKG